MGKRWYKVLYIVKGSRDWVCLWTSPHKHYWMPTALTNYWGSATWDLDAMARGGMVRSSLLEVSLLGRDVPTKRPPR